MAKRIGLIERKVKAEKRVLRYVNILKISLKIKRIN
jgi:hypothetical protein